MDISRTGSQPPRPGPAGWHRFGRCHLGGRLCGLIGAELQVHATRVALSHHFFASAFPDESSKPPKERPM